MLRVYCESFSGVTGKNSGNCPNLQGHVLSKPATGADSERLALPDARKNRELTGKFLLLQGLVYGTAPAENAVIKAGKTVQGLKWARIAELEMNLDGQKIIEYRATTRIYLDIRR